jgi:hypothetical protein
MINSQEINRILLINGLNKDSPLENVTRVLNQLQYNESDIQEVIDTLRMQGWFSISITNEPQFIENKTTKKVTPTGSTQQISLKLFTIIIVFVIFFMVIIGIEIYFYLNTTKINNLEKNTTEVINNEININLASSTENNDTATNTLETLASASVNIQQPITTSSKTQTPTINQTNQTVKYSNLVLNDNVSTKINSKSSTGYNIIVSNGTKLSLILGWIGDGVSVSLTNPQGKVKNLTDNAAIDSSIKMTGTTPNPLFFKEESQFSLMYSFDEPVLAGNWKLVVTNLSTKTIDFSASVLGRSNILIVPDYSNNIHSKNGLILKVSIREKTSGTFLALLLDLNVSADIFDEDRKKIKTVTLSDEPNIDRSLPYDGIYTSPTIFDLPYGDYEAVYTVSGKDTQGSPFAQKSEISSGTYISVSSENAQILGDPRVKGIDFVEGITSIIQADIWVDIKKDGDYSLSADFVSPSGEEMGVSSRFSTITGPQGASLMLNLEDYKDKITNGVYKIKNIQLFELTSKRIEWVDSWVGGDNGNGIFVTQSFIVK